MDNAFRTLTAGGLKFDKRKNAKAMQVFKPRPADATSIRRLDRDAPTTSSASGKTEASTDLTPQALRKKHRLNLTPCPADDPTLPDPITCFSALRSFASSSGIAAAAKGKNKAASEHASPRMNLPKDVLEKVLLNLERMRWVAPTPVQMQAIPLLLADRDVLGHAPTGSGKTLAFLLPTLLCLPPPSSPGTAATEYPLPRALIIEPTRELARQVCSVARALCGDIGWRVGVLGEEDEEDEELVLVPLKVGTKRRRGHTKRTGGVKGKIPGLPPCDILIATPLKLVYHLREHPDSLAALRHLILDEADHLMSHLPGSKSDSSFLAQTDEILAALKKSSHEDKRVQKSLFSATIPSSLEQLASSFLSPTRTTRLFVGLNNSPTTTLSQRLDFVHSEASKLPHLRHLLAQGNLEPPVLLFVQSPERATQLASLLNAENLRARAMHGGLSKPERDEVVDKFKEGKEIWTLVATDVFARGLDFKGVKTVVNFDFPQSAADYVHRIGRAGRNNQPGCAVTLYTLDDTPYLKLLVNLLRSSGCPVPEWMLGLPKVDQEARKRLKRRPIEREGVKKAAGAGAPRHGRQGKAVGMGTGTPEGGVAGAEEEWVPASAHNDVEDSDEGWEPASAFNDPE